MEEVVGSSPIVITTSKSKQTPGTPLKHNNNL